MAETRSSTDKTVDSTSIVRGKNINPATGTQNDGDQGVPAKNVHNEIQIEQAAHTLVQTTTGAAQVLQDQIAAFNSNGNKTAFEAKPVTTGGVQNDAAAITHDAQEEVLIDGRITQGETGPEKRLDLESKFGGASGSNS